MIAELKDDDILSFTSESSTVIFNQINVNFRPFIDHATGNNTFENISYNSGFVDKYLGIKNTLERTIYLYEDGKMDEISQEPTLEMFMNATVRTQVKEVVEIPELVVLCQVINTKKKEGDFKKTEMKNEIHNSELLGLLETYIRKNLDGQSQIKIQNIFKLGSVFLLKSSSKYCENIKREHSSNHIKLHIEDDPKGWLIFQKCFCTCEVLKDRKGGFCKNFVGRKHLLSPTICKLLDSIKK